MSKESVALLEGYLKDGCLAMGWVDFLRKAKGFGWLLAAAPVAAADVWQRGRCWNRFCRGGCVSWL